jgi:hypothetical protein
MSRKLRNRHMHALHGNGMPEWSFATRRRPPRGTTASPTSTSRLTPRQLQELQLVSTLRADGWDIDVAQTDDVALRVYDTRLDTNWLLDLAPELRNPCDPTKLVVVGGDFLMAPTVLDSAALQRDRIRRWGLDGPCHILILPRPHVAAWVERLQLQLDVEDPQSLFSFLCVVDRDKCPAQLDPTALRRLLPQAQPLLDDTRWAIQAFTVGERAPIVRVPADARQLPPPTWEAAYLPRNKILLVLNLRRTEHPVRLSATWIRGTLPDPAPDELKLLRVEYDLPPATRERAAPKAALQALRRVAAHIGVALTPAHRLQQTQVTHGSVLAILAVPRTEARHWLRGSGCGGFYVRPFWTRSTSPSLEKHQFNLLWLRGQKSAASLLWEKVHDLPGVYGLLASDKDVAIRLGDGVNRLELEAQVRLALGSRQVTFHQATPGMKWWRFGPLEDADVFNLPALITRLGLSVHGQPRLGHAGPFRRVAFFQALGTPTRMSLDDGGWGRTCAARLTPALPPPRSPPSARSTPSAQQPRSGPALSSQSTWGGQRQPSAQPAAPPATMPPTHPAAKPAARPPAQPSHKPALASVRFSADSPAQPAAPTRTRRSKPPPAPGDPSTSSATLLAEMQQLRQQLQDVLQQLSRVMADNDRLRQDLAAARAVPPPTSPSGARTPVLLLDSPSPPAAPMIMDDDPRQGRPREPAPSDSPVKTPPEKTPRRTKSADAGHHGE